MSGFSGRTHSSVNILLLCGEAALHLMAGAHSIHDPGWEPKARQRGLKLAETEGGLGNPHQGTAKGQWTLAELGGRQNSFLAGAVKARHYFSRKGL
jgi:hypothetical protein